MGSGGGGVPRSFPSRAGKPAKAAWNLAPGGRAAWHTDRAGAPVFALEGGSRPAADGGESGTLPVKPTLSVNLRQFLSATTTKPNF